MADELETFGDGSVSMMYVAEDGDPWHGKGTPVNGAQTGDQAAEAAGLKWSVRLEPISTQWSIKDAAGTVLDRVPSELPEKFAVVREPYRDTPATPLAVVGDRYQILQNADCFGFFDQLVGEGQAIFRTAGSLFGGRRIWLAAKLPKDMVLLKEDIIEQYLVLASSHDGSMSVTTLFTPIRVVCANTLAMATSQARSSYTFRHQGDMKARFKEAAQALGFATRYYAELEEALKRFTEVSMPETRIEEFVNRFIPMPDKKDRSVLETVATGDAAEKFDRARSNAETDRKSVV